MRDMDDDAPRVNKPISTSVKCVGITMISAGVIGIVLVFLVPYLILHSVMTSLQDNYSLLPDNKKMWSNITNSNNILYTKTLKLYEWKGPVQYVKVNRPVVDSLTEITFTAGNTLTDLQFGERNLEATMNENYTLSTDYVPSELAQRKVKQIRPGVLRAVYAIETRASS